MNVREVAAMVKDLLKEGLEVREVISTVYMEDRAGLLVALDDGSEWMITIKPAE